MNWITILVGIIAWTLFYLVIGVFKKSSNINIWRAFAAGLIMYMFGLIAQMI